MPGFFDFKAEQWPVWGLFGSVFVVFIGFVMVLNDLGPSDASNIKLALKCDNPDCTYTQIVSIKEKIEIARTDYEALKIDDPDRVEKMLDDTFQSETEGDLGPGGEELITEEELVESMLGRWTDFKCPLCSERSVYDAIACPNPKSCDNIFFKGEAGGIPRDKCPKCNYSKNEARKKELN